MPDSANFEKAQPQNGGTESKDQPERAIFYFDLGSPYAYLAAERVTSLFPQPPIWQPVLLGALFKQFGRQSWAHTDERARHMTEIERRANDRLMLPIKWPDPMPPTSTLVAMRTATYATQIGKGEAFALAAFRQAFAGGKDLSELDTVLVAAAACEIQPKAVLKAIETDSVKQRLREATGEAARSGVHGVPTVRIGSQLFWGDDQLEHAAVLA